MEKLKRYLIFFIGLFINSLGVSLITKAALGTSPISSIPYVLSLSFPFTLGEFTIFFSVLLVFLQLLILRKKFKVEHLLQIPISVAFGYFIDLTMELLSFVHPQIYGMKILALLIGCLILGFGVYTEVLANVAMLPGESFVRAIVEVWHTEFGVTKIIFDVSMSLIAVVLSFVFTGKLEGVREGTLIAALLVGFIARTLGRCLKPFEAFLFHTTSTTETSGKQKNTNDNSQIHVITIGRQYGSGGHDIGFELAKRLGYTFYDKDIIKMIAGTTGYSTQYIEKKEEAMTNSLLYDLVNHMYHYQDDFEAPKDKIFRAESDAIQEIAAKGNCVIVGRAADYILRNNPNCLKLFFHASFEEKTKRICQREHLSEKDAKKKLLKEEKLRSSNYHYYTHRIWGLAENYDITLDTRLGIDQIEHIVRDFL